MPWGESWKRNQSMTYQISRLPEIDTLIFINPREVWVGKELRTGEGSLGDRISRVRAARPRVIEDGVHVCNLIRFVPLGTLWPASRRFEEKVFLDKLRSILDGRRYILLNNHPNFFSRPVLDHLMRHSALNVFDISDDFVEYFDEMEHRRLFQSNLEYCCSRSDLVLSINDHLKFKYGVHNPNTHVVSNGTNYSNFHRDSYQSIPFLASIQATGRPILGYTGIINRVRLDYELLEDLLVARPEWNFVFVGSCDPSFHAIVERHENLFYHPQVRYPELPDWIDAFDCAIIPFRRNEHTRGNDLLKFNDYLAMGKSIVTTDMGGARRYSDHLQIASDLGAFLSHIERALANPPDAATVERRRLVAQENSWDRKAQDIFALMREHLRIRGDSK